jgi:serine/threonine-protein kinase RsbW
MDSERVVRLDIPAAYDFLPIIGLVISEMLSRAGQIGDSELTAHGVQLAVHEVCTNIVRHAYQAEPGKRIGVVLTLESEPRRFVVETTDCGIPFDEEAMPVPPLGEPRESGYGLILARELVDAISYRSEAGANHWRLVKTL